MKRTKKLLSALLISMVAVMMFPAVSYGAATETSDDGNWTILADYNKNTCTIIKYHGSAANLSIPSKIDGLKVTSIQMAYQCGRYDWNNYDHREAITSITIPSTVTSIGDASFCNLPNLKSVKIPSSVKTIGHTLFNSCTSLTEFTLPSQFTEIPYDMFSGCTSLSKVTLHSKLKTIGHDAFSKCTSLKTITLPSSLKTINFNAFAFSGLEKISIPNSVTTTDYGGLFYGCENLTSVKLSTGMTSIPSQCFTDCKSLKTITIPANYTSVGRSAFSGCDNLTTVVCRSNLEINDFQTAISPSKILTIYSPSSASKVQTYCSNKGIRWKSLNPPTLTSKTRTTTAATLKWKAVSGATGYKVYKKTGTGSYKLVKTTTSTSYKATGLKKGTTYRFYVTTLKKDDLNQTIESKGSTVYKTYLKK